MSTLDNITQLIVKAGKTFANFLKREEEIKAEGKKILETAVKENDQKKIDELKNKINQIKE